MDSDSFDSEKESYDTDREREEDESNVSTEEIKIKNLDLIKSISTALTMILEENKNLKNYNEVIHKQSKMIFSAKSIPKISIYDYLIRIQTYSYIEKNTLIIALIYIDRICDLGHITLTYYNIHRILFTSVIIAIKYNEDCFYDNKYYSEIAGVKLNELNNLENTFVQKCNFMFYISDDIFEKYSRYLNSFKND